MVHEAKAGGPVCDVLDELEAAIVRNKDVCVWFSDGTHRTGTPLDIFIKNDQDFLNLKDHVPIAISKIVRVEQL